MRKLLVRGALVAFMAAMGVFGGVQFDGVTPSLESTQASAKVNLKEGCERFMFGCNGNGPDPWGVGG